MKLLNQCLAAAGLALVLSTQALAASANGVLVIAPDRGYMGNEEIREAFARIDLAAKQLVFVTDDESRKYFDEAIRQLSDAKVTELSVLPLFVSSSNPGWQLASEWLGESACSRKIHCSTTRAFGESYFAVDVLDEALATIDSPAEKDLVVLSASAEDAESAASMAGDIERIASWSNHAPKFKSTTAYVWDAEGDDEAQVAAIKDLAAGADTIVVSYGLAWKLDSMMSFENMLRRWILREETDKVSHAVIDAGVMSTWLQRETNRGLIDSADDVGVVIHAHGSDYHWNQTMRDAVARLHEDYTVEFAFSMADKPTIENALERLEVRGVRGAVVVRIFGREDSFQMPIEKMLGMDIEAAHGAKPHHHGGHGGQMMRDGSRIRTPLVVTSNGGLGDHPLFAEAMLERAREISSEPSQETVILVSHGTGSDEANDRWMVLLENVAQQMFDKGGDQFRAIQVATWREDWPDKREEWVEKVRDYVTEAQADGGRALVIPARTNAQGPEDEFLEGLDYTLGQGFAPHPLFADWVESNIVGALATLTERQR